MSRQSKLKNQREALKLESALAHSRDQAMHYQALGEHMRNQDRFTAIKINNDRQDQRLKNRSKAMKMGLGIADARYKNKSAIPTQHENNAQLFADIGKSFNGPTGRPQGKWGVIGAGLAKGLEYSAKSKAIDEKNANYDKFDRVMDYLEQVNNSAMEQNAWYEKRQNAQASLMPQIMSYVKNVNVMDAQSRRFMAQDILEQYGNAIGENFKLTSIDGTNPFLMTIQSDKGQQVFDMRSILESDPMANQLVAEKMPEFQVGLQEQRANNQRAMLEQQQTEAQNPHISEQNVPQNSDNMAPENSNTNNMGLEDYGNYYAMSMDKMGQAAEDKYQTQVIEANKQIKVNEKAIAGIERMKEVFRKYPNIGTSYIQMINSGDEESWSNWVMKKFSNKDELAAMQILAKESNALVLSTVLGVPGKSATDLLKKAIFSASPNGTLTAKGFDHIATTWENDAKEAIDFIHAQYRGMNEGKMIIYKGYEQKPTAPSNPQDVQLTRVPVTVVNPETNEEATIDEAYLPKVLASGVWKKKG